MIAKVEWQDLPRAPVRAGMVDSEDTAMREVDMSEVRSDTKARTIVTLFEQYGAGAEVIGPRVAEALGTRFINQAVSSETLEAAAERDLVEENFFERFLRSFTPMPSADADLAWALEVRTDHEVSADLTKRLLAAVEDGGVVLGRNATKILADEPRALHVKLVGSVASRVARAANLAGISIEQASRRQEREDQVRADTSRRLFRWDPREDDDFDLVIDTGTFTLDQAANLVVHAYRLRHP